MKGLKFPEESGKLREEQWEKLKVGDVLVDIYKNYYRTEWVIAERKIIRRTPKGSIRLDNGELLKHFDSEYHVMTENIKDWREKSQLQEDTLKLMDEVKRNKKAFDNNLEYGDALKLKEILEKILGSKKNKKGDDNND